MPDVWASVADLDTTMQERLADVLETRGADPQQQAMRQAFLADAIRSRDVEVLEVGCGTGVLTRVIAQWPGIASVTGVDVAEALLDKARTLAAGIPNIEFQLADARALPFADSTFDTIIFDSTLSHIPEPERAIAEAFRVLRPLGHMAAFDGDYATTTVAIGEHDPLQVCADVTMANSVNDRWLVRRLPTLVQSAGLEVIAFHSHGFVETTEAGYMLTVIDRGADLMWSSGQISDETAMALKTEARRRIETGSFFGHIAYGHIIARKPAMAVTIDSIV